MSTASATAGKPPAEAVDPAGGANRRVTHDTVMTHKYSTTELEVKQKWHR